MDINKFEKKFEKIKEMGWVKNKYTKNKNGGAGNTLEDLLGIIENNLKTPDLGEIELKTTKKTQSGTITLFTHDTGLWKMKQSEVLESYGRWIPEKRRYDLYFIHELRRPTSNGIVTSIIDNSIVLTSPEDTMLFKYPFDKMANRWNEKVKKTILVNFKERKDEEGRREYLYEKYKLHVGEMTAEIMKKAWEDNKLILETSMYMIPGNAVRNHGTKIRIKQSDLDEVYSIANKNKGN